MIRHIVHKFSELVYTIKSLGSPQLGNICDKTVGIRWIFPTAGHLAYTVSGSLISQILSYVMLYKSSENAASGSIFKSEVTVFTIRTDPKPVNNLFVFSKLSNEKKNSRKKTHASVTVTVVRDRKIRTALRTNQIAGFVTVPAWKRIKTKYMLCYYCHCFCCLLYFTLNGYQVIYVRPYEGWYPTPIS